MKNKEGDFERILTRRKKIENYKESSEQMKQEQAKQAQLQANKQEEKRRMEEMKKLLEENKENEKRRKIEEQEQFKRKVRADNLQKQKNHPLYAQLLKEYGEEVLENMDPDQLIKEKVKKLPNLHNIAIYFSVNVWRKTEKINIQRCFNKRRNMTTLFVHSILRKCLY